MPLLTGLNKAHSVENFTQFQLRRRQVPAIDCQLIGWADCFYINRSFAIKFR